MKILLAADGSEGSRHALREAARLLPLGQAEVYVLGVTPYAPIVVDPMGGVGLMHTGTAAWTPGSPPPEDVTARHLDEALALLREVGVSATSLERDGDPAAQILAAAKELPADMIVLGSHGRSAIGRLVLGSVSENVLHHWHGAVLIIRPEHKSA